jgi:hypothetical protein
MSYYREYDLPIDPPEPTEEDWCEMDEHKLSEHPDPETGWTKCMCGSFAAPVEGEPFDEYTSLQHELVEEYLRVSNDDLATAMNRPGGLDWKRQIRARMVLRNKTPEYLRALIASAKNSAPGFSISFGSMSERDYDLWVAVGTHLGSWESSMVKRVLLSMSVYAPSPDDGIFAMIGPNAIDLIHDANIDIARNLAKISSMIYRGNLHGLEYRWEDVLPRILPLLDNREGLIEMIFSIYESMGNTEESTRRIMAVLESGIDVPALVLTEGLL